MNHLVYKTTNVINKKIYIGIHSTRNIDDGYLGSGTAFKRALIKYGKDNFDRIILHNFNTREEAIEKEKDLVNYEFVLNKETYNLVTGGGGLFPSKKKPRRQSDKVSKALESRAKESGFESVSEFVTFMMGFSACMTSLKVMRKEPVNVMEELFFKMAVNDGIRLDEDKLIKYQKYQSQIIRLLNYVIYG